MDQRATQELQGQLQSLRQVLQTERGQSFLDLFDEFMQQREFGLALHAVCDFILGPGSPPVSKSTVEQIRRLHAAMKIDDRCIEELQNQKPE
jgi:hypothetical protein